MKLSGTDIWASPNTFATDESGFSALPGGYRNSDGSFDNISYYSFFWSATESDNDAWIRSLYYYNGNVDRNDIFIKSFGASVRCLKD
jgi:uncharacterized protein (TIGR02145 family)